MPRIAVQPSAHRSTLLDDGRFDPLALAAYPIVAGALGSAFKTGTAQQLRQDARSDLSDVSANERLAPARPPRKAVRPFAAHQRARVLGGSGGLGLATADKLARHGMRIAIVHRDRQGAMERVQLHFDKMAARGVGDTAAKLVASDHPRLPLLLDSRPVQSNSALLEREHFVHTLQAMGSNRDRSGLPGHGSRIEKSSRTALSLSATWTQPSNAWSGVRA